MPTTNKPIMDLAQIQPILKNRLEHLLGPPDGRTPPRKAIADLITTTVVTMYVDQYAPVKTDNARLDAVESYARLMLTFGPRNTPQFFKGLNKEIGGVLSTQELHRVVTRQGVSRILLRVKPGRAVEIKGQTISKLVRPINLWFRIKALLRNRVLTPLRERFKV